MLSSGLGDIAWIKQTEGLKWSWSEAVWVQQKALPANWEHQLSWGGPGLPAPREQ